jgi:hypothetical protein
LPVVPLCICEEASIGNHIRRVLESARTRENWRSWRDGIAEQRRQSYFDPDSPSKISVPRNCTRGKFSKVRGAVHRLLNRFHRKVGISPVNRLEECDLWISCEVHILGPIGYSQRFPNEPDCILSILEFVYTHHRTPTAVQSLTAFHMLDVAHVGSYHADCPIPRIITIPEFYSRPGCGFLTSLGTLGSKGFPATSSLATLSSY